MNLILLLSRAQIRVTSSLFTDLAAGWLLGMFAIQNPLGLTGNLVLAIVCLLIATRLEELNG